MTTSSYAVIPAAGIGRRMGGDVPKQYLSLAGKTVIENTIARLLQVRAVEKIVVVVAPHDRVWPSLDISEHPKILTAPGGAERCHSVLNGLEKLGEFARDDNWVMVHDAARPCVRVADIEHMFNILAGHKVGGILAAPVRDTLKRAGGDQTIAATVDRNELWQAFTPQMFKLGMLTTALQSALEAQILVTDEAQSIERQGHQPMLIEGHTDNIKITRPEDLTLAELYLGHQANEDKGR